MTQEQKKEFDVLRATGLASMPEEAKPNGPIWVRAILKVKTFRGGTSYALATGEDGTDYRIIRTFDSDGIAAVVSIHPYERLNRKYLPAQGSRHELINFISDTYGVDREKVESLTGEDLRKLIIASAIRRQLAEDQRESTMELSRDAELEQNKAESIKIEETKDECAEKDNRQSGIQNEDNEGSEKENTGNDTAGKKTGGTSASGRNPKGKQRRRA